MKVTVRKNGVVHDCTSEEQLKRFLAAGYVKNKTPRKPDAENSGEPTDENEE